MNKLTLTIYFTIFGVLQNNIYSQVPTWEWIKSGQKTEDTYPLTKDKMNYIYMASNNLAKYDSNGNIIWGKNIGYLKIKNLILDTNGFIYTTGITLYTTVIDSVTIFSNNDALEDMFLAKFDTLGNIIWGKSIYGSDRDFAYDLTIDDNHNIYITGTFYSDTLTFDTVNLYTNNYSPFLAKFNTNGDVVWAKKIFQTGWEYSAYSIAYKNNALYVTGGAGGLILGKYDLNGNLIWMKQYSEGIGRSLSIDENNNIYVLGDFSDGSLVFDVSIFLFTSFGNRSIFLVKFDSSGIAMWADDWNSVNDDYGNYVTIDDSNNVYITGEINQGAGTDSKVLIAKFDGYGNLKWSKLSQGSGGAGQDSKGTNITVDHSYNVYLTGIFDADIHFDSLTADGGSFWNTDYFFLKGSQCKPVANFNYIDLLLTVNFIDSTVNGKNFIWDFGDGNTDTTQNPTHTYINEGTYNVCLVSTNICGIDTICNSITVFSTGIQKNIPTNKIKIFPNPFNYSTTLEFGNRNYIKHNLTLYDVTGRPVHKIENINSDIIKITKGKLIGGLYFFQLQNDTEIVGRGKIIIE